MSSSPHLSRAAKKNVETIARVEQGVPVYAHTLGAIAKAFSEASGREIDIHDLDGVKIAER